MNFMDVATSNVFLFTKPLQHLRMRSRMPTRPRTTSMLTTLAVASASAATIHPPAGAPPQLAALPLGAELTGRRTSVGHSFTATRLALRPHAYLLRNLLSQDECDALITSAKRAGLHTAETTGKTASRRRCDVCTLSPWEEPVVKAIQIDVARLLLSAETLQLPGGGCEDLHVLRYQPGGEYLPHYDAMTHPRVLTVLYYLNGEGATWFPLADKGGEHGGGGSDGGGSGSDTEETIATHADALARVASLDPATDGVRVEPASVGDALAFYNFDGEGYPDPLALHAGCEVAAGATKWIGTHFFNAPALSAAHADGALG